MKSPLALAAFSIALVSVASIPEAQSVLVVDAAGGPGSDFTGVDAAVNAASEGDIILVREGDYVHGSLIDPLVDFDGKSLTLIADAGADVSLSVIALIGGGLILPIQNLAANQTVAIRGIEVGGIVGTDNLGTIWIEDSVGAPPSLNTNSSARFTDCAAVVFNRCSLAGRSGPDPGDETAALMGTRSGIHVFDTDLDGGSAGGGHAGGFVDAPGAFVQDGFTYISGGVVDDLTAQGATSETLVRDTLVNVDLQGGTTALLPGNANSFEVNSPVREGETLSISFEGTPGDLVLFLLSGSPNNLFDLGLGGTVLVDTPTILIRHMGFLPASGAKTKNFTINDIGAGNEGFAIYSQGWFLNGSGLSVGGGSLLVLLDDSL